VEQLDRESPFYVWWLKRCEKDWLLAYGFFRWGTSYKIEPAEAIRQHDPGLRYTTWFIFVSSVLGIFLFLFTVALVGWVQFEKTQIAGFGMSAISLAALFFWQCRIESKWRYLLAFPENKIIVDDDEHDNHSNCLPRSRSLTELFQSVFPPNTPHIRNSNSNYHSNTPIRGGSYGRYENETKPVHLCLDFILEHTINVYIYIYE
jgi:hypothetical protein